MTLKCDGTNGVLQQYDYQTPSTGFSYTFAAGTQMLFMVPAATLATGTITMPASPADGMVITFSSSQQITALTVQGNTGQSVSNAVTFLPAQTAASYVYRLANTTWYPCQTVPGTGSQLVSGTSQATTSGTSKDFTGIPSWVKRITFMFNGFSTSGSSNFLIQLGTGGSIVNTGYTAQCMNVNGAPTVASSTAGFIVTSSISGTDTFGGPVTISLFSTGAYVYTGALYRSAGAVQLSSGYIASLGGTIDRVRITTVNGTDSFDAGSVNILYE